jgi:hypothetical protein
MKVLWVLRAEKDIRLFSKPHPILNTNTWISQKDISLKRL